MFPVVPQKYNLLFNAEKNTVNIDLSFIIKDDLPGDSDDSNDDHETLECIRVEGQLVQLEDGRVAFDWVKGVGNAFWVSSFLAEVNGKLRLLA